MANWPDRIRCVKDTGPRNLPLKAFSQNQLWCEVVTLACDLLAWTKMLALAGNARRWEPQAPAPEACRALALGRRANRRRRPPAGHPVRLTSWNNPTTREEQTPEPVEPRPAGATAGRLGIARTRIQPVKPKTSGQQITDAKGRG